MKIKNGYRFLVIIFFLALCLTYTADARADELVCPEGWQEFVWAADGEEFDDIKEDWGTITYTEDGLLIDNREKGLSWSYSNKLPRAKGICLRWHANLQVRNVTGAAMPGVGFGNSYLAFVFRVDKKRSAGSFILSHTDVSANTIEEFDLPKFDFPCTISLRYDVVTRELTAFLNDAPVKKVTLPHYGMPALSDIQKISIQTANPPLSFMGSALYGDMTLWRQ